MGGTKICSKCKIKYEKIYFGKQSANKDGLKGQCKNCEKEYRDTHKKETSIRGKKWREENKEADSKRGKEYRQSHKEMVKERAYIYKYSNLEQFLEHNRVWYRAKRKKEKEEEIEYRKNNNGVASDKFIENKGKIKKRGQLYCINNKETIANYREVNKTIILEKHKIWCKNNKDKVNVSNERRRAKKKKLSSTLTVAQWEGIKQHFNNQCCYCGKELPLTIEHFVPISKNGEYTTNNIICSCLSCNSSKGNKDFFEFYPTYKYYSKKREKAILDFLHYNNGNQQISII